MPAPVTEFDGFRVVESLGRGAMGHVYLGEDTVLNRAVAIKFIAGTRGDIAGRERFAVEARAIARLQHPNIPAIFRVGEVAGTPYLVSELVRGQSLDHLPLPLAWPEAQRIVHELAKALVAAHRAGVLHRDLKPSNVMLTWAGAVKLCDFGLAKLSEPIDPRLAEGVATPTPVAMPRAPALADGEALDETLSLARRPLSPARAAFEPASAALTQAGAVLGSPRYMSPEQWLGLEASARSDLYSLGVLAYELCTGEPPVAGPTLATLRAATLASHRPSLSDRLPPQARAFAGIVERCLRADPALRFASATEVNEALDALALRRETAVPEGNPYRGLQAFDATHRALFFGRDRDLEALVSRLRDTPLLVIAGDSGVGKSSLCLAGVVPRLLEGALGDGRSWTTVSLVPGRQPFRAAVDALAQVVELSSEPAALESLGALLDSTPGDFARQFTAASHGNPRGLLVYVDQLEELFTNSEAAQVLRFARLLAELPTVAGGIRVVTTVRCDFLTRLSALPSLGALVGGALHLVRPLDDSDLRSAVVGPARAKGYEYESAETVDALVAFAREAPGALPLLQFALAELWEQRDVERRLVPAQALAAIGGPGGALARHAEGVYAQLPADQRGPARELMVRLATAGRTRLRRTERELTQGSAAARLALGALVRGRLLTTRQDEDAHTEYALAHEGLLDGWARLREWLGTDADRELACQRLALAAGEWVRLGRNRRLLWTRPQLVEHQGSGLPDGALNADSRAFLRTSLRAARRERLRRAALWLAVPLTVVVGAAGWAGRQRWLLDEQVERHRAGAARSLALANDRQAHAAALRVEAFAKFDALQAGAGETLWAKALEEGEASAHELIEAERELEKAFILDAARADVRQGLVGVLYARAEVAEREGRHEQVAELLVRLEALDLRGEVVKRWQAPATLRLDTSPPGFTVMAHRYTRRGVRRELGPGNSLGETPLAGVALAPGSYLLLLASGGRTLRLPLQVERGEHLDLAFDVPERDPEGYVFIPPGRFLYGSQDDEEARRTHLYAQPLHRVVTDAYWIGRTEVTFGEYLRYLRSLTPAEQRARTPQGGKVHSGIELSQRSDGVWTLELQPATQRYRVAPGQRITYAGRRGGQAKDWLKLPATGLSWEDAQAYAAWLDASGQVPGARPCTEHEWERAARGADDRLYPHADALSPDEANFDETYGRTPSGFGPDEVGSHPASDSPFGIADLAGNVWEWTRSVDAEGEVSYRGGGWYESRMNARSNNRQVGEPTQRDLIIGMRVCAPYVPSRLGPQSGPAAGN